MADESYKLTPVLESNAAAHLSSKLSLFPGQPFDNLYIKSGHTVLTNEILASDIPFFNASSFSSIEQAWDILKDALKYNDLIQIGSTIYKRTNIEYQDSSTFPIVGDNSTQGYFEEYNFSSNNYILQNHKGENVIKFHPNSDDIPTKFDRLTMANNSGMDSNGLAWRLFENNVPIERFISPSDKILKGYPSTGYRPTVKIKKKDTLINASEKTDFYFYPYNGTILLNTNARTGTSTFEISEVNASCYEYIGVTLDTLVSSLSNSITQELTSGIISTNASFDAVIDYNDFKSIKAKVEIKTFNETSSELIDGTMRFSLVESTSYGDITLYEVNNRVLQSTEYIDNTGKVYIKSDTNVVIDGQNYNIYAYTGEKRRSEDVNFVLKNDITNIYINPGNIYATDSKLVSIPEDKIEVPSNNTGEERFLVLSVKKDNNSYSYNYKLLSRTDYLNENNLTRVVASKM